MEMLYVMQMKCIPSGDGVVAVQECYMLLIGQVCVCWGAGF